MRDERQKSLRRAEASRCFAKSRSVSWLEEKTKAVRLAGIRWGSELICRPSLVCSHFIGHVPEQRLRRANLKITFGFAATRFRSVRGTENEEGRSKQRNRYENDLFVHGVTHKGASRKAIFFQQRIRLFVRRLIPQAVAS
jgi:hypothetical protein